MRVGRGAAAPGGVCARLDDGVPAVRATVAGENPRTVAVLGARLRGTGSAPARAVSSRA
ncbi:hypothetical protein [Streptomyces omiyaensis]|uniref:hypothetical protein n=1 Tax=Streptomyces omiyaensis TaxID=68247 RepID=UPI0036FB79C1